VVDETTIVMAQHGKIFSFIWLGATENNAGKRGGSYLPPGMPNHTYAYPDGGNGKSVYGIRLISVSILFCFA